MTPDGRRLITGGQDGTIRIWEAASAERVALWASQDRENARRRAAWQRPGAGDVSVLMRSGDAFYARIVMQGAAEQGFIRDWLVLAPLPLDPRADPVEALDREQLAGEARLRPRVGERAPGLSPESVWQAHHGEEPVWALAHLGPGQKGAVRALVGMLEDKDEGVRFGAALNLGRMGSGAASAVPMLLHAYRGQPTSFWLTAVGRTEARKNTAEASPRDRG